MTTHTPIPLDSRAAELLELGRQHPSPPLESLSIIAARAAVDASLPMLSLPEEAVTSAIELAIPLYRPLAAAPETPLPVVAFFHGGGWCCCSVASHDSLCRYLANRSGAAFLSVDYRLAPEHRFPAALEDCERAVEWLASGVVAGIDPARIALAGDSSGGNLAAVVAQRLAGRVALRHQLLIYPVLDCSRLHPSAERYGQGYFLDVSTMDWFTSLYARSAADRADPDLSPLLRTRLQGVASATLLVAGYDMNRDEAVAYAGRLLAEGVAAEARMYPQLPHGFASMAGYIESGRVALDDGAAALKAALA
jgi:acetyl esterase